MPDLAEVAADPAPAGSFRHIAGDPRGDRRPILQQKDYCEDCQYQTDGLQHQRIERSGNAKPPGGSRNRVTKNRPESESPDPDIEIVRVSASIGRNTVAASAGSKTDLMTQRRSRASTVALTSTDRVIRVRVNGSSAIDTAA